MRDKMKQEDKILILADLVLSCREFRWGFRAKLSWLFYVAPRRSHWCCYNMLAGFNWLVWARSGNALFIGDRPLLGKSFWNSLSLNADWIFEKVKIFVTWAAFNYVGAKRHNLSFYARRIWVGVYNRCTHYWKSPCPATFNVCGESLHNLLSKTMAFCI